eukprot:363294-Chlamydomonas_euryale.AAC.6
MPRQQHPDWHPWLPAQHFHPFAAAAVAHHPASSMLVVQPRNTLHHVLLGHISVAPLRAAVVPGWPPDWSSLRGLCPIF